MTTPDPPDGGVRAAAYIVLCALAGLVALVIVLAWWVWG